MTTRHIFGVVNQSTLIDNSEVEPVVEAIAHQLRYHAGPAWGLTSAAVILYPDLASVPKNVWIITLINDPDEAGALAWHSESPDGRPYGVVFIRTCMENNVSWSSALSHEVLEGFLRWREL